MKSYFFSVFLSVNYLNLVFSPLFNSLIVSLFDCLSGGLWKNDFTDLHKTWQKDVMRVTLHVFKSLKWVCVSVWCSVIELQGSLEPWWGLSSRSSAFEFSLICVCRFDALAEEPRGAVLDNMFMGGSCIIRRPPTILLYHRVPHNFEKFDIKVVFWMFDCRGSNTEE